MNQMSKYLVAIILSLVASAANSASVGLQPGAPVVAPGGTISFALLVNFGTQSTSGGAVDIKYDPSLLSFGSFVFDPAFGPIGTDSTPPNRDPLFDVIQVQSPGLLSIGFGNFSGITGAFTAGEVSFEVAPGAVKGQTTSLTLADSAMFGPFFGVGPINYTGAKVTIGTVTAAVPEAASAWLFTSGLAVLGIVMLRRRADLA